jgi:peptidoglycan/xylan/chitin deacetylase (PgdA/CDA1 family)
MTQGVMFHHFHGNKHAKSQGSISNIQLTKMVRFLKKNYNLLSADEFLSKSIKKKLNKSDICLTFDDGLKCQYDVAFPVLKKEKIKAFFFIYSSTFDKKFNLMEVFRNFSNSCFKNIDNFYQSFFSKFKKTNFKKFIQLEKKFKKNYLKDYKFYSVNDRKYRFARDIVLSKKEYEIIVLKMMKDKRFNYKKKFRSLFMSKKDIKSLIKNKNIVGLHSHNHFVNISKINSTIQKKDYIKNYYFLKKNFNIKPVAASYPFGRYNLETLKIMRKLKIQIAFLSKKENKSSNLTIGRLDHANLIKKI